jgi:two-component system, OmpR family, response regulator
MTPSLTKILYVEDEEYLQKIARMALERVGNFTVEICGTGAEALERLDEFNPDMILLDVRLPVMNGPEVLQAIRLRPAFEKTPAVFITASVMAEDIESYRGEDVSDIISKPFDPMTLSEQLQAIWDRHHLANSGSSEND